MIKREVRASSRRGKEGFLYKGGCLTILQSLIQPALPPITLIKHHPPEVQAAAKTGHITFPFLRIFPHSFPNDRKPANNPALSLLLSGTVLLLVSSNFSSVNWSDLALQSIRRAAKLAAASTNQIRKKAKIKGAERSGKVCLHCCACPRGMEG